jgi:hypothetical protein
MAGTRKEPELPETLPLYNVNDGIKGRRNGGPWLDEVQAQQEEDRSARAEGRKPNYNKLQGGPSLNLVTEAELVRVHSNTLNSIDGPEVTAPVYGEIANPAVAEKEARQAEADAVTARATSEQRYLDGETGDGNDLKTDDDDPFKDDK